MSTPAPEAGLEPSTSQLRLRRELIIASICLALGLFVAPALIFMVGSLLLGPYGDNQGVAAFYSDFFVDLARPSGRAWAIALGPLFLVSAIRIIFIGVDRSPGKTSEAASERPASPPRRPESSARVEPRVTLD